jgi:ribosome-associated protein
MTKETDIVKLITEGIQDPRGKNIQIVDLSGIDGVTAERFIICQGNSTTQVAAIADSVREKLQKECGIKPYNYDGYKNSQWIVIDYGDTFVHIFLPETRRFYNLEELWSDAPISVIPDID